MAGRVSSTSIADGESRYQTACKHSSNNSADSLWDAAKEIVKLFFGNAAKAAARIKNLTRDSDDVISGILHKPSMENNRKLRDLIVDIFDSLLPGEQTTVRELVQQMSDDWRQCYFGRSAYRVACEKNRHGGHDNAYWNFKVAATVSYIISAQGVRKNLLSAFSP